MALVGYWRFDEGSGSLAIDSSGYRNSGSLVLAPTYTTSVPSAITFPDPNALTFNGSSQYVNIPSSAANTTLGALSISAWIKLSTTANDRVIVSKWGSNNFAFNLLVTSGKLELYISPDSVSSSYHVTGGTTLSTGVWYYVTAIFTPSTRMEVFVNNVSDGVKTSGVPASMYASTAPLSIGWDSPNGVSTEYFSGSMDDVRIYNRVLTAGEISGLYAGSLQPLDQPFVQGIQIQTGTAAVSPLRVQGLQILTSPAQPALLLTDTGKYWKDGQAGAGLKPPAGKV